MVWFAAAVKPRIAISMGDPGGVGPEVIVKALARAEVSDALEAVIYGNYQALQNAIVTAKVDLRLARHGGGAGDVLVIDPVQQEEPISFGTVSAANGRASYSYIRAAADAVFDKRADAICTAPISKEALHLAGYTYPGHTEMLAHFCGRDKVRMMLVGGGLNVVLQTIHVALRQVPDLVTTESVLQSLRMIRDFGAGLGEPHARIAVCGLNPHAGEAGQFGREELEVIQPAVERAQAEGMKVTGPVPGDTVFHRALEGEFDYVLAMYHDQALIPVKTLDFHGGVNVTIGLPLLRTSPDHGTAFGIAGRNMANESSMAAALLYASRLVRTRSENNKEVPRG